MQLQNAIRKINKAGYKVNKREGRETYYSTIGKDKNRILEFHVCSYSGNIQCIGVRSINDQSDPMTDYCAFVFYDNLSQVLNSSR